MAFRVNVSALDVAVRRTLPDETRRRLRAAVPQEMARVRREQAARSGGIEPDLADMVVDGRRNATVFDIGHNSRVLLDWNYLGEAVVRAVEYLETHGPERSGRWKRSIVVFADGNEIGRSQAIPRTARRAHVAVHTPYARRLEVGKSADGTPFAVQVPMHFVELASMRLANLYPGLARWDHTFIDIGEIDRRGGRLSQREAAKAIRYPAIYIEERQAA